MGIAIRGMIGVLAAASLVIGLPKAVRASEDVPGANGVLIETQKSMGQFNVAQKQRSEDEAGMRRQQKEREKDWKEFTKRWLESVQREVQQVVEETRSRDKVRGIPSRINEALAQAGISEGIVGEPQKEESYPGASSKTEVTRYSVQTKDYRCKVFLSRGQKLVQNPDWGKDEESRRREDLLISTYFEDGHADCQRK